MSTDSPSGGGVNGERMATLGGGQEDRANLVTRMGAGHLDTLHLSGYMYAPLDLPSDDSDEWLTCGLTYLWTSGQVSRGQVEGEV